MPKAREQRNGPDAAPAIAEADRSQRSKEQTR